METEGYVVLSSWVGLTIILTPFQREATVFVMKRYSIYARLFEGCLCSLFYVEMTGLGY